MNWREDPRIQKLLEKATLESLFKCYFQRVYGIEEITEMEKTLQYALTNVKCEKCLSCECSLKGEKAAVPLDNECLDRLAEITLDRGEDHSPDALLILIQVLVEVGYHQLACELIWCSALLAIQEFIADRQLKVLLNSHEGLAQLGKRRFASALSRDIGRRFAVFEMSHHSFFANSHDAEDVKFAFRDATEFIQVLKEFRITDELKKELEMKNFNI